MQHERTETQDRMNVIALTASDCRVLAARYGEHGNSHRRLRQALLEAGAVPASERLTALRRLERQFDVDLGEVCWRFERRADPANHPIERFIIRYITQERQGGEQLWVLLDRVRQLRELKEGRLVGEPES
jgi:hypothetical protein